MSKCTHNTPFKPGSYFYETLSLPEGVEVEIVQIGGTHAVRLMFVAEDQTLALATELSRLTAALLSEARVMREKAHEPPVVNPEASACAKCRVLLAQAS